MSAEKKQVATAHGKCAVTGREWADHDLVPLAALRPALARRLKTDHPDLAPTDRIGHDVVDRYRAKYVEELLSDEKGELNEIERRVAESLASNERLVHNIENTFSEKRTLGERLADNLASFGGSWSFILSFGAVLVVWIVINAVQGQTGAFDPYPFILLNLVLSTLAALQAPVIMMSQKRQETKDRVRSLNDYQINLKAELEIRHLHEKLDHLINNQWQRLAEIQQLQLELMNERRS